MTRLVNGLEIGKNFFRKVTEARKPWIMAPGERGRLLAHVVMCLGSIPWHARMKRNAVQKVAGTLRVPSAEPQKTLFFEGYGTWNVPTTLTRVDCVEYAYG